MTTITHLIDTLTEWARLNICEHVLLKQPPADLEAPVDEEYEYKLVHPAAFPLYMPTAEKLPPTIHSPFPSLCVRFMSGADNIAGREGGATVQLGFSAWNPGTHEVEEFTRTSEGWRDVWNFVDVALRAVESTTAIGGYTIDPKTPVEFGPWAEQEAIPDFYPYWFAWVTFRVTYPLLRNVAGVQEFL